MPQLQRMPVLSIGSESLLSFGRMWQQNGEKLQKGEAMQLGGIIDGRVGESLATMLGGIRIVTPNRNHLLPSDFDCVEVGPCRIIGGVRPQNFDVGYRPDGVRFAFDSKTLNDKESVKKNYQNMINDLATEATTVHTRFPYAVVAFLVAVPTPAIVNPQLDALTQTLERLSQRIGPIDSSHKAEAISLVLWDPYTGEINPAYPNFESILRIEKFSEQVEKAYVARYKGLPPHHEE